MYTYIVCFSKDCRLPHYKEHSRSEFSTLFHTRQFHQTTFLYRQTIQSLFKKETGLRISLLTNKATRKLHKELSKLYASSSNGVQSDDPKVQNQKEGDQSSKKKQSKTDTIVKGNAWKYMFLQSLIYMSN